ncbi:hypothetical protein K438DRAFT_1942013 [Mycena galopus ATCC 62051]|nr:hypothetical protein K438DRAFT_1942013 [Mycena galopus ATCC 62051]
MPITFAPATRAGAHDTCLATSRSVAPVTAAKLLSATACSADVNASIARSCIGGHAGPGNTLFKIAPAPGNGFVDTVLCAYTHNHALVIRPDDVWLAVVSQFSFYATAEGNSGSFLDNGSEKTARLSMEVSVESGAAYPDVTKLSRRMMRLLQNIVPDADLRDWLIPKFSTTAPTDATISCLLVLSASCLPSSPIVTQPRSGGDTVDASGMIPRVTLEGERADWELLVTRIDRLKTGSKLFGLSMVAWYHLLHPVLSRFVSAFDDPEALENREFWRDVLVAKEESNGSGDGTKNAGKLSGWITAFCAFSAEGTWLGPELTANAAADKPFETLTAAEFWSTYGPRTPAPEKPKPKPKAKAAKGKKKPLQVDFDIVDSAVAPTPTVIITLAQIPPAYASAELELTLKAKTKASGDATADVNSTTTTRERAYTVLAGLVGTGFSSSRDTALSTTGRNDTVRPVVAWWLYEQGGAGAAADADGSEVLKDRTNVADKAADSEENIHAVPAPRVQFDLDVGLEDAASPTAMDTPDEPQEEPVSTLSPVQESDPWSLALDAPVIPEPPAQTAVPSDAVGSGGGGGWDTDANADAGEWNSPSWGAPAPASTFNLGLGFGGSSFGFGSSPAAVPDSTPATEQEMEAVIASGGQDEPTLAPAATESELLANVEPKPDDAPAAETGGGGEDEVKPPDEQVQQSETPAPPAPEEPEPQAEPNPDAVATPAAPANDGGDGDGGNGDGDGDAEETADAPNPAQAAKGGAKTNAKGGAKAGKGKKKGKK